jgi:hypothetical protein
VRRAEHDRGRPGERAASSVIVDDGDKTIVAQAVDSLEHHQRRVLVEGLLDGWGPYWERRARTLEAARPRAGDFHGHASREDLRARYDRLTEAAQACRARAQVSPLDLVVSDVDTVLNDEVFSERRARREVATR